MEPAEILSKRLEQEKGKLGFNSNKKRFPTFLDNLKARQVQTPGPGAHDLPDKFKNIVVKADREKRLLRRVQSSDANLGTIFNNMQIGDSVCKVKQSYRPKRMRSNSTIQSNKEAFKRLSE